MASFASSSPSSPTLAVVTGAASGIGQALTQARRTLRPWWPQLVAGRGKPVATLSPAALQSVPGTGPCDFTRAA